MAHTTVKTLKELQFMSEEMQVAYIKKCVEYFDAKYGEPDKDGWKVKEEDEEEFGRLMEIFRYSRINDLY